MPCRSDPAGFFNLFQVPFFGSTRAASILPSRPPNLAAAASLSFVRSSSPSPENALAPEFDSRAIP
jgi:hypothetical protein